MTGDKILITRPERSAVETAQILQSYGFDTVIEPMLYIEDINVTQSDFTDITGFIFTSMNGVCSFARQSNFRDCPVYVVGSRTADEASKAGFKEVYSADGDAQDLAALIAKKTKKAALYVHYRGRDLSRSIGGLLADRPDCRVTEEIIYQAHQAKTISPNLLKSMEKGEIGQTLFYSTRTAQAFVDLMVQAGCMSLVKPIKALCLADSMVESLADLPWKEIIVSTAPNEAALLSLLDIDIKK